MHKKALTVAIAGVLAAPMAAQAVDFSISGHINRALFNTDSDSGNQTEMQVENNGSIRHPGPLRTGSAAR